MLASAIPSWLLSDPGAKVGVMGGVVLEASHSVRGCGCSWVSHSAPEAGLEEVGAEGPQSLDHGSGGWAVRRCHCLSVAGGGAVSGCPGVGEAAWGEILREGLSSPHSCSPGGPLAGWADPGWWHRGSHCSEKPCWPPAALQRWALYYRMGLCHYCGCSCNFDPGDCHPCPEADASSRQAVWCGCHARGLHLAGHVPGG